MPDALRMQIQCTPNGFGRGRLAGMRRQPQSVAFCIAIDAAEQLRRRLFLISTDAHSNHVPALVADSQLEHFLGLFHAEVAGSIKDPEQRYSEIPCSSRSPAFQGLKNGIEILLPIETDSHRDVYLGMQHVFFFQLLHQAVSYDLVVFRAT